jgi:hypothetical protein
MNELQICVNELTYICKNDGTAMLEGGTEYVVVRGFVEMNGILKEIRDCKRRGMVVQVIIPNCVEKIEKSCFLGCWSLSEVIFESGSNLNEIGPEAFDLYKIKGIEISAQCEILTGMSLMGLEFVSICEGSKSLMMKDDFVVNKQKNKLIRYCGRGGAAVVEGFVESICNGCFSGCESRHAVIFESDSNLKKIGARGFRKCDLTSIRITKKVEKIGKLCFKGCKSVCEVIFEAGSNLPHRSFHEYFSDIIARLR